MLRSWQTIEIKSLHVRGMALFPIIFVKYKDLSNNKILINHERIHFRQQLELLIIPFYLLYLINYLINRIKYKSHDKAYMNICFEREAYSMEKDLNYLTKRNFLAWITYL